MSDAPPPRGAPRSPMRPTRTLALIALAFTPLGAPGGARAAGMLQPGAVIRTSETRCTLNFAYAGGSGTYLGTAAHCVSRVGEAVRDADGDAFGNVAVRGNPNVNADDYALIRVRDDALGRVSPRVKGSPQYPTGVTAPADTAPLDAIRFSGNGLALDLLAPTRERRIGALVDDDESTYRAAGVITGGDSGGPLVHARTGRALGIVSRVCVVNHPGGPPVLETCTVTGPTVQGILARSAASGLALELVTGAPAAGSTPPSAGDFAFPSVRRRPGGALALTFTASGPGTLDAVVTAVRPTRARYPSPSRRRFTFAARRRRTTASGIVHLLLRPTKSGAALRARHRRLKIPTHGRLTVTWRPAGGTPRTRARTILLDRGGS
ncbi:MAG: S1 family peptidase [Actinomycetota bacterium]|nr:S1 family peptidase [Actinomycetota bacterium]